MVRVVQCFGWLEPNLIFSGSLLAAGNVPEKKKPKLTSTGSTFGIEVIDQRIENELESLRVVVETFLRSPEPPTWDPPVYATPTNREFLASLRLPTYRNGNPSLLFHDLDVCDGDEIKEIFGKSQHMYVVITCSSNSSHHRLQVHLQHIWIGQDTAHVGMPH
jgi:hypothetical protein